MNLLFFRGEILERWILQDVVQTEELRFDVIDLVRSAMSQVLMPDNAIDGSGAEMKHTRILAQSVGVAMSI